jgi:hypothetical protein
MELLVSSSAAHRASGIGIAGMAMAAVNKRQRVMLNCETRLIRQVFDSLCKFVL